jgi:D-2-hydroxyacid dehydrogenase (NADP+)
MSGKDRPAVLLVGAPSENFDAEKLRLRLAPQFPSVELLAAPDTQASVARAADAQGMIGFGHLFNEALVGAARRLKWIQTLTTGTDALLRLGSLRPDTVITSVAGLHAPQMSEMAFLHMLALARDYPRMLDNQRSARWERWPQPLLYRKTAVILGVGAIALGLARRCKAFDMHVIGVSSTPRPAENFDRMIARAELEEAASLADFLIAVVPLTSETRHIVSAKVLAAMKPSAYFINLARGGVCDEEALLACLKEKRIAGAGLDVFKNDPLPAGDPVWDAPNVLITPHMGGFSDIYAEQFMPYVEGNLACFADGRLADMVNVVRR